MPNILFDPFHRDQNYFFSNSLLPIPKCTIFKGKYNMWLSDASEYNAGCLNVIKANFES